jgi:hypothetical protein
MSDQIEAAAGLATASLAAHALDAPGGGNAAHSGSCANCGTPLSGPFCAQCGQRAHLHRSVGEVFHEFLHGITHFDGKAWKTLPMLLFHPGRLTRSYIDGHRARYIAPVPLFLLVIFLMFFSFSFVSFNDNLGQVQLNDADAARGRQEMSKAKADIEKEIAAARGRGDMVEVRRLETGRGVVDVIGEGAINAAATKGDLTEKLADEVANAAANGDLKINFGVPWLDEKARDALRNPRLMLYKLQSKAYKLSFMLVPLSLPWLWLVFWWRRGVSMYDHAIFTLYSISFMSLMFIAGSILLSADVVSQFVWVPFVLAPGVHMFAQLRGAYALGWWGAGWRTVYLSMAASLTLSFYLVLLIVAGVLD